MGRLIHIGSAAGVSIVRYEHVAQDERGIWWTSDGTGVGWFNDVAGNILSLHQLP